MFVLSVSVDNYLYVRGHVSAALLHAQCTVISGA